MTETPCPKCHSTGYLSRRFYTDARTCSCERGQEVARFNALSADERQAEIDAHVAAVKAERRARREARR